jgi:LytS/YehU family sensor histidine kinase
MSAVLAAIDTGALLNVVIVSIVSGGVIIGSYSVMLYGVTGYLEQRRAGLQARALPYALAGLLAGLVFAAAVVYGVVIMTTK